MTFGFPANAGAMDGIGTYHGLVGVHRAPGEWSALRGSVGENNLGFRCLRKRFWIETVHVEVEAPAERTRAVAFDF